MGWGCYYLAMTLRDVRKITGGFRRKVDLVSQILETIKERTENTVSYLPPLVEGVTKLVEHFIEKKKNPKVKK